MPELLALTRTNGERPINKMIIPLVVASLLAVTIFLATSSSTVPQPHPDSPSPAPIHFFVISSFTSAPPHPESPSGARRLLGGYSFTRALNQFESSFYWAIIGLVAFCISFPCLYWNEGRNVTRTRALNAAKDECVELNDGKCIDRNYVPLSENNTKLVHLMGKPWVSSRVQVDYNFGVESHDEHGKKVLRRVHAFQWVTCSHTEQRPTGRRDDNGNEEYEDVRIVDPPQRNWVSSSDIGATVEYPEFWSYEQRRECENHVVLDFRDKEFRLGVVKIGPYELTDGMVDVEMEEETAEIPIDADRIKKFVSNDELFRFEPDPEPSKAEAMDVETGRQDNSSHEERGGLLSGEARGEYTSALGQYLPYTTCKSELTPADRKFIEKAPMQVQGSSLYIGAGEQLSVGNPEIGDFKVEWVLKKLQSDSNTKIVPTHTALAEQALKQSGGYGLHSWMPDSVATFHLDSCCKIPCCIGYYFVEDPPDGCGLIAMVDGCFFSNASNDSTQDGNEFVDMEQATAADNSRQVEKVVRGEKTTEDLIHGMEDTNAKKTSTYRKIGFLMMLCGFQCMFSPFPAFFGFIPFVGQFIGFLINVAVFILAIAVGCFGAITTISIAWLRYRPLWGIVGILVSGGIVAALVLIPW